jgi:hypothetical protein
MYKMLRTSNSLVFVIDCEIGLINVMAVVFSDSQHVLCIWHVDKNVLKNCRSYFADQDFWTRFFDDWHKVMYASFETEYESAWTSLQSKYEKD